jgi:cyclase
VLKKRLVGVVTVKNGRAVQSFGYQRYLPLGKPECLVENLDRWGADEILVQVIDCFVGDKGPDFELLERLAQLGLETPLIYGGGIRSVADGVRVIQAGADRLTVDALLHDSLPVVRGLADRLGAQAVIASMPMATENSELAWLDYRNKTVGAIGGQVMAILEKGVVSEVLLTDWRHEGRRQGFDLRLVQNFPLINVPLIAFGGLSEPDQMIELLRQPNLSAVAVGNFLSYREHAVQQYKEALAGMPMRAPAYESEFSLLVDV